MVAQGSGSGRISVPVNGFAEEHREKTPFSLVSDAAMFRTRHLNTETLPPETTLSIMVVVNAIKA
jgi:hypothetical protein